MAIPTATRDQITQLRRHAVNDVTRGIMARGVRLTWKQADDLGDEVLGWMKERLGLAMQTTDAGVTFAPSGRYFLRVKTGPHQQWTRPVGWSYDGLDEAKRGAREAGAQWLRVELIDATTGRKVQWRGVTTPAPRRRPT